jgi:hypothetical protein
VSPSVREHCRHALARLQDAIDDQTSALTGHVAEAERLLVRARDELIAGRRRAASSDAGLDDVNAILTLVAGVEYPLGRVHREALRSSAEALGRLLEPAPAGRGASDSPGDDHRDR